MLNGLRATTLSEVDALRLSATSPYTGPRKGRLFRPLRGLVSRAGMAGGRAQNQDAYRPALTHASWVNIKAGWYNTNPRND